MKPHWALSARRGSSHLASADPGWLEGLYENWRRDPHQVPERWAGYFSTLPMVGDVQNEVSHERIIDELRRERAAPRSKFADHQAPLARLADAFRRLGHLRADLDPLQLQQAEAVEELNPSFHGLEGVAPDQLLDTEGVFAAGPSQLPMREILRRFEHIYCGSIGVEFMHLEDADERRWLREYLEADGGWPRPTQEERRHLLERLCAAEGLEKHLARRYPGTKRFGLEGGESLIPLLDEIIQRAGAAGNVEIMLGMAHRGRLNVLVNILGKNPSDLFGEFEGVARHKGSGDVKYHQGFSSNVLTAGGEIHLALAFNPSHLEIVSPVVMGSVRARQDRRDDRRRRKVLPILIHGDAAIAAQGVVMESLQMSATRGFGVGGCVHVVVNNQIGFTISRRDDARSTRYCSDVIKMIGAPALHVNGDDPEAALHAARLAIDYRQRFGKDVLIDLVCFRRSGHNEADDPFITQPLMYKRVRAHPGTRAHYAKTLIDEGVIDAEGDAEMGRRYHEDLKSGEHVAKSLVREPDASLFVDWSPYLGRKPSELVDTHLPEEKVRAIGEAINALPADFKAHPQVEKLFKERRAMIRGEKPMDWGCAEMLAYASLLDEGYRVRISGQDSGRGTFAHRHAVLRDQSNGAEHVPLRALASGERFGIYDSLLSEVGVLAFEYGYAATSPDTLTVWEAQFGDFANGAQVVIDQFLSSGEQKWGRLCGLTLLLPHGYEGQGPEHSSARLERFLQLCAESNMQVCMPSTAAQIFHLLRRQMLHPLRRPLVALTPKSMLRDRDAASRALELSESSFVTVLPDKEGPPPEEVRRLVLCSGKVYYDLKRRRLEAPEVGIVRLEQLYPFPSTELGWELLRYPNLQELVWCQEEPLNQGAWYMSRHRISRVMNAVELTMDLEYAGRPASAASSVGYMLLHQRQQERLIVDALDLDADEDN